MPFILLMKKLIPVFAFVLLLSSYFSSPSFAQNEDSTFKPHWSFNGQIFADYYNMLSADTASGKGYSGPRGKFYYEPNSNTPNGAMDNTKFYQAFDMRRVQLGANYYFSKNITAKVLLEHESAYTNGDAEGNGTTVGDAKSSVYVKEASLTFSNWIPMANVIFGQQAMNVFSVDEGLWGCRSVEKSILDLRGSTETGSNDLGIQAVGNFDDGKNFGYSLAIVNSDNSSKVEDIKDKVIALDLNAKLLDKHLVLDVSGDDGGQPSATETVGTDTLKNVSLNNSLWKAAAAYTSSAFTVGVVYANHMLGGQSKSVAGNDAVQSGLSVFAHATIIDKALLAFARYDMYDPDTKANDNSSGRKENTIIAGLDWIPDGTNAPNVHVDPNIEIDSFKDKGSQMLNYEPITVLRLTFFAKF
jgi:hypothetical protein